MKLGSHVSIIANEPDLANSLPFYEVLGYELRTSGDDPAPWMQLSDGVILLLLAQSDQSGTGLVYYADDMDTRAGQLMVDNLELISHHMVAGYPLKARFFDPDGLPVYLLKAEQALDPQPAGNSHLRCGTFGEFSIPTRDLKVSLGFWEDLGFIRTGGDEVEPYPYAILNDGLITLGLHQTSDFDCFMITCFAADMPVRIEALRKLGMSFSWQHVSEQGHTTGARMQSPGGQGFFLFQEEGW